MSHESKAIPEKGRKRMDAYLDANDERLTALQLGVPF